MAEIDVTVEDRRWSQTLDDVEERVRGAVGAALAAAEVAEPVEIGLVLADDAAIRELNRTWRSKDHPTNVLSFPSGAPANPGAPRLLGDVVLAYDTLLRESDEAQRPLADHLAHLVVHGTLHLLGHDHEVGEAAALAMERLETEALRRIGVPDPYAEPAGP